MAALLPGKPARRRASWCDRPRQCDEKRKAGRDLTGSRDSIPSLGFAGVGHKGGGDRKEEGEPPLTPLFPLLLPYKTLLPVCRRHTVLAISAAKKQSKRCAQRHAAAAATCEPRMHERKKQTTPSTLCLLMGLVLLGTYLLCFTLLSQPLRPSCPIVFLPPHVPSSTHTTLPTTKYRLGNAPGHGAKNRNFFRSRSTPREMKGGRKGRKEG